jgi:hypothetical protein
MESFGNRDQCIKTTIQNLVLKFGSVLVIGNNMLTGQNFLPLLNLSIKKK